jgi:hypothetical protein
MLLGFLRGVEVSFVALRTGVLCLGRVTETQSSDLFKAHHVMDEVGELDAGGVTGEAYASLPECFHRSSHLREDVFDSAAHFGAGAVCRFLFFAQWVRFAALDVDVSADCFGREVCVVGGTFVGAVCVDAAVPSSHKGGKRADVMHVGRGDFGGEDELVGDIDFAIVFVAELGAEILHRPTSVGVFVGAQFRVGSECGRDFAGFDLCVLLARVALFWDFDSRAERDSLPQAARRVSAAKQTSHRR